MAELGFLTAANTSTSTLAEPFPVTTDNIGILCDSLVFTYPKPPPSKTDTPSLLECLEQIIERELEKSSYTEQQLAAVMKIDGEVCEMRHDMKDRLGTYQKCRAETIKKNNAMDLRKSSAQTVLNKVLERLEDMIEVLEPIEFDLRAMGAIHKTPLAALRVKINEIYHQLSIKDELAYLKLFKCQTMLIRLGIVMTHRPMDVASESKSVCSNVAKLLSDSEFADVTTKPLIGCRKFLKHYASYMWNIAYLYRIPNKTADLGKEKSFLAAETSMVRHCVGELESMAEMGKGDEVRKSITASQATLRVSLNCLLMMHYYKEFNFQLAYRTHKRTTAVLLRNAPIPPWIETFKETLDKDMEYQFQTPLSSWDVDIARDDDSGEFGRKKSAPGP